MKHILRLVPVGLLAVAALLGPTRISSGDDCEYSHGYHLQQVKMCRGTWCGGYARIDWYKCTDEDGTTYYTATAWCCGM